MVSLQVAGQCSATGCDNLHRRHRAGAEVAERWVVVERLGGGGDSM